MRLPESRVPSTDRVQLAVHDFGGRGRTLMFSHATGFHGRCYVPIATSLSDRFESIAFDYRGHGDTDLPAGPVVWERYGDDALAMSEAVAAATGEPIVAFGHSMGGACLLMAARRRPGLFSRLVVFEPIVFPPGGLRPPGHQNPLAAGARHRRAVFPSYDAAIENFASKPPLGGFDRAALEAYVHFGFREGDDGQVHLKCRPETEAQTYEGGDAHDTWDALTEIETPVLVVAGMIQPMQPSSVAAGVAERLPNGVFLELADRDHFAPMTHPAQIAALIADFLI